MEFSDIYDLDRFSYEIPPHIITHGRHQVYQLAQKMMPLAEFSLAEVSFNYNQSCLVCKHDQGKAIHQFSLLYSVHDESFRLHYDNGSKHVSYPILFDEKLQTLSLETIKKTASLVSMRYGKRISKDIKIIEICGEEKELKLRLKNKIIDCDVEHKNGESILFVRPSSRRRKRPFPEMQ